MKAAIKCVLIILVYAGFFIVADSRTEARFVCLRCASNRVDIEYRPFRIGSIATFRGIEKPTAFTAMIRPVEQGPCSHQWLFERRTGDCAPLARMRQNRLQAFQASGALTSVFAVDPEGGVELIRWMLRMNDAWPMSGSGDLAFSTREAFRAWFEELKRRSTRT